MPDALGLVALAVGAIVASTVGGVAGFGAGVIMIPLIAWIMGVKATVPVLTVAMLMGNGARVWFSRREIEGRVVVAFLAGAIPTGILGAMLYARIEGPWISRILGVFLLSAVPLRRLLVAHDVRVRLPHFPAIGAAFGFLSSLVGSTGPVMSPFFLGYGLTRGAFIATDALCTVGMYIPRGVVFQRYNLMTEPIVGVGLYIGAVMILGAWLGRRILDRLTERTFLRIVETLIVLAGLQFLLFPRQ
ncbi:MAG TPA: sulfite exporter TauE/SafE family protein [Methylomirabilota bacterium]|nr:sulfite exporter TauE/SafE family protein [Methylomirabilota bacterium]